MENIILEKVDMIRERLNVSYKEAKFALETCEGDVLESLIFLEKNNRDSKVEDKDFNVHKETDSKNTINLDELRYILKEILERGNVTRIKIKKEDKILVDIPVTAGIAGAVIGIIIPQILAVGLIAAIATKITIEITKEDGSVEVVNEYVSKVATEVKEKANDIADKVKNKAKKDSTKEDKNEPKVYTGGEAIYSYTVKFDDKETK